MTIDTITFNAIGMSTAGYVLPSSHILVNMAASTNVKTIYGGTRGALLTLRSQNALTLDETGGNLKLTAGTLSLAGPTDTLTLLYDGTNWLEVSLSQNT